MRFGLRWQILLSLIALMVATVLLVSLAILGLTQSNMERQARQGAERIALIAATTMSSAIDPDLALHEEFNRANLERLCGLFSEQFAATRMAVVAPPSETAGLTLVASYPPSSASAVIDVELLVARAERRLISHIGTTAGGVRQVDVFAPVLVEDSVVAVVRLEYPLADVQRLATASQQLIVLYIVLDAVLIVLVGLFILTRLIVRPLQAISLATDRVASGDLNTSVQVNSRNEIGVLSRNFDGMVERLRDSRDALERRLDELARSKEALERAQDELLLSEKMATMGGLAAGIAHEVGNPLAAVIGLIEFLRDRDGLEESEVDDLLARVDREVGRINDIITELLDYARVSRVEAEPVSVLEPLTAASGLCHHHPRGKLMEVEFLASDDSPVVWASENRLTQVFLNLLLNAADAAEGPARVRLSWHEETVDGTPGVRVDVADDGPGIPADVLRSVFEPFFTTKGPGEGTGLGLAMSQRIVDEYRGRIWAESPPGEGAVFHVWIPSPPAAQSAADGARQMPEGK